MGSDVRGSDGFAGRLDDETRRHLPCSAQTGPMKDDDGTVLETLVLLRRQGKDSKHHARSACLHLFVCCQRQPQSDEPEVYLHELELHHRRLEDQLETQQQGSPGAMMQVFAPNQRPSSRQVIDGRNVGGILHEAARDKQTNFEELAAIVVRTHTQ